MEGTAAARKFDGRFRCHKKSSQKVPWMHGKLMKVAGGCADVKKLDRMSAVTRKVDGRSRGRTESSRKLTERPATAQKVD